MTKESKIIDLQTVIGVYPICNTGAILVHQIDYPNDRILASMNGENPEWCEMKDGYADGSEEYETGFYWGEFFVPFADVMRM